MIQIQLLSGFEKNNNSKKKGILLRNTETMIRLINDRYLANLVCVLED